MKDVKLAWDANTEPDVIGYKVYWGIERSSGGGKYFIYDNSVDVGNVTSYTLSLGVGKWYIATTAYDNKGYESEFSNFVTKEVIMAVLTVAELAEIRKIMARNQNIANTPVTWVKADINAALQAIEDWYESERANVSALINTATSPFVFTNAQKKKLGAYWLQQKFKKEVV